MAVGYLPASFAVRPRQVAPWTAFALVLALVLSSGCSQSRLSRRSMRPVYLAPAPAAVVPTPSATVIPPVSTSIHGGTVVPSTPARSFDESGLPASAPIIQMPAPSPYPSPSASPPSLGPASRLNGEEPRLEPSIIPPPGAPELTPPAAGSQDDLVPPAPSAKVTNLRTRLAALVNDPGDLFQPPKADRNWRYIVIHHSASDAGSYSTIDRQHRDRLGTDGCGYHFVIGNGSGSPDGQIEVTRRWAEQKAGAHCRDAVTSDVNDYGIGICLVGDFEHREPTPRQLEAAQSLVAYLSTRYRVSTDHIGVHARFARTPTVCPGRDFPIQAIIGNGRQTADSGRSTDKVF